MDNPRMDELARRFAAGLPQALGALRQDVENNFRAVVQSAAGRLDLTSRAEFDVQAKVLERALKRLAELEARLKTMEESLSRLQGKHASSD